MGRKVSVVMSIIFSFSLFFAVVGSLEFQRPRKRLRLRGRCNVCHRLEAKEWLESAHSKAWVNETFKRATNEHARKECLSCHAPDRILVTGWGKEPKLRTRRQEDGVDCVSCHEDSDGAQHGTIGTQPEDHDVVKDEKFGTVAMCATCHARFGTVDEFKGSKWGDDPRACVTCHMPEVKRPIAIDSPERVTRAHTFKGADPEMFQRGVKVTAKVQGDKLVVRLASEGVGHKFPTGIESIVAVVDVRVISGGQEVLKHQTLLANDINRGGMDTRLKPGEIREIIVPLRGKKGEALVRILHKHLRALPDEKATVLFETKVTVP